MGDIYGELEDGLEFLLTPQWLKDWEVDELETFKEEELGIKVNKFWFWVSKVIRRLFRV